MSNNDAWPQQVLSQYVKKHTFSRNSTKTWEMLRERERLACLKQDLEERGLFSTLEEAGVGSPSAGPWLAHTLF